MASLPRAIPRWLRLVLVGAGLLVGVLWLRWPTLGFNVWNVDEAIHAAAARTLLEGGVLYRDAIDQRTPLSYYAVAAVFAVAGENNLWAVRAAIAVLIAATAGGLFLLGSRLRSGAAGGWAAVLYGILASALLYPGDAFAANTEWFVAFFTTAAAVLFLSRPSPPGAGATFGTGCLFGAAFLSKQPALLDLAAPAAVFLWLAARQALAPRIAAWRIIQLAAGWLAPVVVVAAWLGMHGALGDACYYTWTYNLSVYGADITTADRVATALLPFRLLGTTQVALLVLWLAGAAVVLHRLAQRTPTTAEQAAAPGAVYLATWTLTSLAGAASAGRGFDHYAIQFLPVLALGGGAAAAAAGRIVRAADRSAWSRWLAAVLLLGVLGQLGLAALGSRRRTLPPDPSLRVAAYIRAHSDPAARIFVWGFHPDIYLHADRRPASRFLYGSFVTGLVAWTNVAPDRDTTYAIVPGALEILLQDLARHDPEFIVDCSAGPNRHWQKYPLEKFPALHAFIHERYKVVEGGQFIPQGFRLFQRDRSARTRETQETPELGAALKAELVLGTLGQPLAPALATAPHGAAVEQRDGRTEFFAHAPSALVYRVPAGAGAVRGGFGFRAGAYAADNPTPTDGAEFVVRWRDGLGVETVLYRRLLRPRENEADRSLQSFRVALPSTGTGDLILAINPGPADNAACDWTYWTDLMLENFRLDAHPAKLD